MDGMRPTNTNQLIKQFASRASAMGLNARVMGDGSINSEIAVIAEAPGEREVDKGVPLVGGSGRFLWDALRPFGITRQHCYVTNVVKRQVSLSAKTDERDSVNKGELEHWEGLLEWELAQLPNVKYIIALGNYALHAVSGEHGVTNWRGSVLYHKLKSNRTVQVLVTYNPAMILREPKWEPIFKFDLHKFKRVMEGTYKEHRIEANINPSPQEAIREITRFRDEKSPISFDIETIGGETACVGLANSIHAGTCINFRDRESNRYSTRDEMAVRLHLQRLFNDDNLRFVAQNGNFDCYWLWYKDRIRVLRVWFDTMLAHHTLYPQLPHNLGFLTSQYTDHPFYKDDGKDWREGGDIDTFWRYNVTDCCITLAVQRRLMKELQDQKLDQFFFDHVMRIQKHLVGMTVNGVKIDMPLKEKIASELSEQIDIRKQEFLDAVCDAVGDPHFEINPRSPMQLSKLFFRDLKLVGRGTSTNKENRDRIRKHPRTNEKVRTMLDKLDQFAKDDKFLSTYANMRIDEDGRIRCEYKQYGVQSAPGRLSSAQTLWGSGMNLQNQPERAYPMFIADEGYAFVYFDLSQAEARIVAYKAQVKGLMENFELAATEGIDVHRANAARIFNIPYDEVPEKDRLADGSQTMRYLGKRCVHGLNYRMQPDRLASTCNISLIQAQQAFHAYHRAFPEIKDWWEETLKEVRKTRMLFNAYQRRWIILERIDDDALDSVIAFYPQSTIGDKINRVIYQCHEDPKWPKFVNGQMRARIVLNIHDALIALVPLNMVEHCARIMKKHADEPVPVRGELVHIPSEFGVSVPGEDGVRRWSTIQKVKDLSEIEKVAKG